MTLDIPPWAATVATALPYPLAFAAVSGAHLYGFASVDSDLDLRAAHVLPAAEVLGLRTGPETVQRGGLRDGVELDVVSHDLRKFAKLLAGAGGEVLEQLLSPLVVATSPLHDALRALAPGLVSRRHAHHYLGFSIGQQRLLERTGEVKPALYTLRVLLTGTHLMRTGELETDLNVLAAHLPYVPDLIARKRAAEHEGLPPAARADLDRDIPRLRAGLEAARDASPLPAVPAQDAVAGLHDLVLRTRLATVGVPA